MARAMRDDGQAMDALLERPWRLHPATYREMEADGVFRRYDGVRVEYLEGIVVPMSPPGDPHDVVIAALNVLAVRAMPAGAQVRPQMSLDVAPTWMPQPDLAVVLEPDVRRVGDGKPSTAAWVVEVAETSLSKDLAIKAPVYAAAGVPELWVVDVVGLRLHRFTGRAADRYEHRELLTSGTVAVASVPGLEVDLDALWRLALGQS